MKGLIQLLFGTWETVRAFNAVWHITSDFGPWDEKCSYEIKKLRGEHVYRVVCRGYKAKHHKMYSHVVEVLQLYRLKTKQHERANIPTATTA